MVVQKVQQKIGLVLAHHGVVPDVSGLTSLQQKRHVSQDFLAAQLSTLAAQGFEFVPLSELAHAVTSGSLRGRKAAVTFDDGLSNVLEFGIPVLRSFRAKACVFFVGETVEKNRAQWTDVVEQSWTGDLENLVEFKKSLRRCSIEERDQHLNSLPRPSPSLLNRTLQYDDLKNLDLEIFELGYHSYSHPSLLQMNRPEILARELTPLMPDISLYAYPFGEYDSNMKLELQKEGYKAAFTTRSGLIVDGLDPFELPRIEAHLWENLKWQ